MTNPFQGDNGGADAGLPSNANNVCPIFGMQTTPVPKAGIVRGGIPEFEIRISYPACIKEPCHLWDADEQMCCIKAAATRLKKLSADLAPLKNMFGGR